MVPEAGIEPARLAARDFESRASTNSTTRATLCAAGNYGTVWGMKYPTIEDSIGKTPLVRLQRIGAEDNAARGNVILGKLEGNNPAGSVKDRPALSMIQRAQERGEIKPGDTLIEATSGNTGIALAMAAAGGGGHAGGLSRPAAALQCAQPQRTLADGLHAACHRWQRSLLAAELVAAQRRVAGARAGLSAEPSGRTAAQR